MIFELNPNAWVIDPSKTCFWRLQDALFEIWATMLNHLCALRLKTNRIINYTLLRKMGSATSPFPTEQPSGSKFQWHWRHLPSENAVYANMLRMCLQPLPGAHFSLHVTHAQNGFSLRPECRYMWHRTTVTCDTLQKRASRSGRTHFDGYEA